MDFISLASEQYRFLRRLDEYLESNNKGSTKENDIYYNSAATASEIGVQNGYRPLFSQTAEAELFLLATNFLLYVAMVLVVIMVCKIYFPEMLKSRSGGEGYPIRSRHFNYRVAESSGGNAVVVTDDNPFDDDNNQIEDDDEVLDSDDENRPLDHHMNRTRGGTTRESFLEFQQELMPKSQVLRRLVLCSIMLNIVFVTWGALQVSKFQLALEGGYFLHAILFESTLVHPF